MPRVVIVNAYDLDEYVFDALDAGGGSDVALLHDIT